jgi:hypothetical protein
MFKPQQLLPVESHLVVAHRRKPLNHQPLNKLFAVGLKK